MSDGVSYVDGFGQEPVAHFFRDEVQVEAALAARQSLEDGQVEF